jgi:3',5'-cyclic AMP phosphodiesterase CpdA
MFKRLRSVIGGGSRQQLHITVTTALLLLMAACSVFEYHPYETNIDDDKRNLNSRAFARIASETSDKDTLTIIAMGDTQRFYDEVDGFVKSANRQDVDFVLLNGDISDFGLKDEFEWVHERMRKLNKPYVAVIGNHDLSGNGETVYKKMYGSDNDSFIVNRIKFIILNTNSREYHFNGRVPDIQWLKDQLAGEGFDRAVVVSHISPYDNDFDENLEQGYASALRESGKVNLSLHGHRHSFQEGEPYGDGIRYIVSTSMDDRMYLLIKLFGDSFTMEKVFY